MISPQKLEKLVLQNFSYAQRAHNRQIIVRVLTLICLKIDKDEKFG